MDKVHQRFNLKKRYQPSLQATLTKTTCPATRIANGTTHYLLYRECVEAGEPLCIVEHDAEFVNEMPTTIDGVIQISSHQPKQLLTKAEWAGSARGRRMRYYEPNREVFWTTGMGVVKHPLNGTNGTSGYIIDPKSALRMIEYIKDSGIAFGDRIRTEHIGEEKLWLQKPQSVLCYHNRIKSHEWARRVK